MHHCCRRRKRSRPRRLALAPSEVLAVEDSQTGITSALAAGLRCAALGFADSTGYHGISDLHEVLRIARG